MTDSKKDERISLIDEDEEKIIYGSHTTYQGPIKFVLSYKCQMRDNATEISNVHDSYGRIVENRKLICDAIKKQYDKASGEFLRRDVAVGISYPQIQNLLKKYNALNRMVHSIKAGNSSQQNKKSSQSDSIQYNNQNNQINNQNNHQNISNQNLNSYNNQSNNTDQKRNWDEQDEDSLVRESQEEFTKDGLDLVEIWKLVSDSSVDFLYSMKDAAYQLSGILVDDFKGWLLGFKGELPIQKKKDWEIELDDLRRNLSTNDINTKNKAHNKEKELNQTV